MGISSTGGFNWVGTGSYGAVDGGGASDVRVSGIDIAYRVVVTGGGGGGIHTCEDRSPGGCGSSISGSADHRGCDGAIGVQPEGQIDVYVTIVVTV